MNFNAASITKPLGFFVLALLIVEAFLGFVLVSSNISIDQKFVGMEMGIGVFILLIIIVAIIDWYRPTHLVYDEESHLKHEKMNTFGNRDNPRSKEEIMREKLFKNKSKKRR